jgi:GntR family transcriptional regulator
VTSDVGGWRGIADDLRSGIRSGRYPVGTRLPSIRQAKDDYDVAVGTVQTALDHLVAEGLVEKRHGSGHWVIRAEPPAGVEERLAALEERVERLERGDV